MYFLMNGRLANARAITKQLFCYNVRPEVANDVISGVDVELVGMNVPAKFDDSTPHHSRDIRLPNFVRTTTTTTTPAYAGHHIRRFA